MKKFITMILIGSMALSMCSCKQGNTDKVYEQEIKEIVDNLGVKINAEDVCSIGDTIKDNLYEGLEYTVEDVSIHDNISNFDLACFFENNEAMVEYVGEDGALLPYNKVSYELVKEGDSDKFECVYGDVVEAKQSFVVVKVKVKNSSDTELEYVVAPSKQYVTYSDGKLYYREAVDIAYEFEKDMNGNNLLHRTTYANEACYFDASDYDNSNSRFFLKTIGANEELEYTVGYYIDNEDLDKIALYFNTAGGSYAYEQDCNGIFVPIIEKEIENEDNSTTKEESVEGEISPSKVVDIGDAITIEDNSITYVIEEANLVSNISDYDINFFRHYDEWGANLIRSNGDIGTSTFLKWTNMSDYVVEDDSRQMAFLMTKMKIHNNGEEEAYISYDVVFEIDYLVDNNGVYTYNTDTCYDYEDVRCGIEYIEGVNWNDPNVKKSIAVKSGESKEIVIGFIVDIERDDYIALRFNTDKKGEYNRDKMKYYLIEN